MGFLRRLVDEVRHIQREEMRRLEDRLRRIEEERRHLQHGPHAGPRYHMDMRMRDLDRREHDIRRRLHNMGRW